MPTVAVNLSKSAYVQVNTGLHFIMLQAHRDTVRIVLSDAQPALTNTVFHKLGGESDPLQIYSPDTNIWALAQSDDSSLIVTEQRRLSVDSMMIDVSRGQVPGAYPIGSFGERSALAGETNRVIWPNGIFTLPPAAGVQMSIVSSSVNDAAAGTHIRTVELHYLDNSLIEQTEIVTLNGTTPVLTVATNIRFINCMHIQTYGTTPYAAGDITASNGGTIYSQINTNEVRCTSSMRMVPAGKKCFVAGASASSVSGTSAAKVVTRIVASELDTHQYIDPLILIPFGSVATQDSSESFNFPVPLPFSAGSVIGFTGTTDKDVFISASWFGWVEDVA